MKSSRGVVSVAGTVWLYPIYQASWIFNVVSKECWSIRGVRSFVNFEDTNWNEDSLCTDKAIIFFFISSFDLDLLSAYLCTSLGKGWMLLVPLQNSLNCFQTQLLKWHKVLETYLGMVNSRLKLCVCHPAVISFEELYSSGLGYPSKLLAKHVCWTMKHMQRFLSQVMLDCFSLSPAKKAVILNDGNWFTVGSFLPLLWKRISGPLFLFVYEHGDITVYNLFFHLDSGEKSSEINYPNNCNWSASMKLIFFVQNFLHFWIVKN